MIPMTIAMNIVIVLTTPSINVFISSSRATMILLDTGLRKLRLFCLATLVSDSERVRSGQERGRRARHRDVFL